MCGHDDEIESVLPRNSSDLGCSVSRSQDSWILPHRKLFRQERIKLLPAYAQMLLRNLGDRPYVKLQAVVAGRIDHMDQRNLGSKQNRCSLHISSHGKAGG